MAKKPNFLKTVGSKVEKEAVKQKKALDSSPIKNNITILPELKKLIPPLSNEEYFQLKENILAEGCRDPLVLWQKGSEYILIDGHNRHTICNQHKVDFKIVFREFKDISEVKEWMINNQLGKRNISAYTRSVLALELEGIFQEKAKANLVLAAEKTNLKLSNESTPLQKSANPLNPVDTRKEVAKTAGVSHDTISKVKKIQQKAPEEIKQKLEKQEISINQAYQEVKKLTKDNTKKKVSSTDPKIKELYSKFRKSIQEKDGVTFDQVVKELRAIVFK